MSPQQAALGGNVLSRTVAHRPHAQRAQRRVARRTASASLLSFQDSWDVKDAPSLAGKCYMVTGSTTGIGYETAKWLAGKNADVILAGRSEADLNRAKAEAQAEGGRGRLRTLTFDLESFADVQKAAEEFKSWGEPLHCLINNAGLFLPPHSKTRDGFEVQLQANYYSHWLLTHLVLDQLKQRPPSRIVWTSSQANAFGKINWGDLRGEQDTNSDFDMYSQSKLMMLSASYFMNKHLGPLGVTSLSAHPGIADTNIYAHQEGTDKLTAKAQQAANPLIGQDQKRGALSLFRAAADPAFDGRGGNMIGPNQNTPNLGDAAKEREPVNELGKDDETAERLYRETRALLEAQLGSRLPALV